MLKKFAVLLVVSLLAIVGLTPSPALAYTGLNNGPYGYTTVYINIGWDPLGAYPLPNYPYNECHNLPSGWNEAVSSVDNERGVVKTVFYSGGNCSGASFTIFAQTDDGQLTNGLPPGQGNDDWSSYKHVHN